MHDALKLTEGSVDQDVEEIENAGVGGGEVRNNVRDEYVNPMDEGLANNLLGNIKEPTSKPMVTKSTRVSG